MGEGRELRELARALLHPVVAWTTAWRGDPRRDWWAAFLVGLLVMMFAAAGAFVGLATLMGRVVETAPSGLLPLGLGVAAVACLVWAGYCFVLIWVAVAGRVWQP